MKYNTYDKSCEGLRNRTKIRGKTPFCFENDVS